MADITMALAGDGEEARLGSAAEKREGDGSLVDAAAAPMGKAPRWRLDPGEDPTQTPAKQVITFRKATGLVRRQLDEDLP